MQIQIKTAEEFRDGYVTIEIKADPSEIPDLAQQMFGRTLRTVDSAPSTGSLSDRLYTAEEVGDLQYSEAELIATPLRALVEELKVHVVELEAELAQQNDRAAELRAQLNRFHKHHVCTDSCKPNQHVAFTGKTMLRDLETKLAKVSEIVWAQGVGLLVGGHAVPGTTGEHAEEMAQVITRVRSLVSPPTSQA